jgi:3-methyladenine DNA glycosylase AlkD
MPSRVPGPPPTISDILQQLEALATPKDLANLQRFGITSAHALGISMANVQKVARAVGRDHATAEALWASRVYEARLLAAYVDDPAAVTVAQMDRWCRGFDSWGVCDTLCFVLFDRTPHAWRCVDRWANGRQEFVRRASFALMASLAVHDKAAADALFAERLPLIASAASDERDLVRKGVSWALRTTGRRNPALHRAALAVAAKLAASPDAGARWVGKDALRDLNGAVATRAVQKRAAKKR